MLARFRETIPTVKSVLSSEIQRINFGFLTEITILPFFQKLEFLGSYSRALRGVEERYPKMEKLILEPVTTTRKLRPYFQAHTIEVPTEHPMKQILHKPEASRRLIKWAIELSEFDIKYKPRTTIKG